MDKLPDNLNYSQISSDSATTSRIKSNLSMVNDSAETARTLNSNNSLTSEIEKYDKINNLKNKLRKKDLNTVVNEDVNMSLDFET